MKLIIAMKPFELNERRGARRLRLEPAKAFPRQTGAKSASSITWKSRSWLPQATPRSWAPPRHGSCHADGDDATFFRRNRGWHSHEQLTEQL
jgi:hypothetical protein